MYNILWANVYKRVGCYLFIGGYFQGVIFVLVFFCGIVWDYYFVGYYYFWGFRVGGEEFEWMFGIKYQGLFVCYLSQVLYNQLVLCLVLKNSFIVIVGDQFMWVFGNFGVQVVLNYQYDCSSLLGLMGIFLNWLGVYFIVGMKMVYINVFVVFQFFGKFRSQDFVLMSWEVVQGIFEGQCLVFIRKYIVNIMFWCMVYIRIVGFGYWQCIWYFFQDCFLEFGYIWCFVLRLDFF